MLPSIGLHGALAFGAVVGPLLLPEARTDCTRSSTERARSDVLVLALALEQYAQDREGRYPDSLDALVVPDEHGERVLQAERLPRDPWKQEYHYEQAPPDSPELGPRVWSHGKDGQPGGGDDIDSPTVQDD